MGMIEVERMEGFLFFWISWAFWILATFFMKRSGNERLILSIWLLLFIIISENSLSVFGLHISYASIFLFTTCFFYLAKVNRKVTLYIFLCTFIIMLAYASFHIFELFDPVWLIFPRYWMLSVILVVLSIVLQKKKFLRFFIMLLGSIQGDFLYAIILTKYSFPYLIGSFVYLDVVAISACLLAIWNGFELIADLFAKYYSQSEKEKQKLT